MPKKISKVFSICSFNLRYVSFLSLTGLVACASGPLRLEPRSDHAFSQAYYYAIFAAMLYFLVASLMAVTVWGANKGHYDKEFQLTMSQRTLMLQTISFLVYLLLGAVIYSHIEGWQFLDALYWADYTLLTVGIGNYAPKTNLGRGLLFPFAIGGIIILGLVIGSIRSLVLDRGKVKIGARIIEKERRRLVKNLLKKNKAQVLEPVTEENAPRSRVSTKPFKDCSLDYARAERKRREEEFQLMRSIQERAATKRRWASLIISGTTWIILWLAGAGVFEASEYRQNWSYFESLYFAYTSLLTIGYGDIYPQSNSGKPFFVFWSMLAIPSLTILISNMGDTIVKEIRDLTIWIGTLTVLPGEKGVLATLKESAHVLTRGRIFSGSVNEIPPGFLGENNRRVGDDRESKRDTGSMDDSQTAGKEAGREVQQAEENGITNDELPSSRRHYHSILIKEISQVMRHLNSSPPRKYTFDEWAWFLKLIGEDESSSDLHGSPTERPNLDGGDVGVAKAGDGGRLKWSWVGDGSPLMGHKEEPEWVLERLTTRLDKELEEMTKDELVGKAEVAIMGRWRRKNNHDRDENSLPENSGHTSKGKTIEA
jgi:potassium channel subfamily K, other eukaryote